MTNSPVEPRAGNAKPALWRWIQIALTLASIVGLVVFCSQNAEVFGTILELDLGMVAAVFAAYLLLSLLRALALKVTHYQVLADVSLKRWWAVATVTGTLNLLLIGAAGGAWRALTLKANRQLRILDSLTIQFWIFFSMILVASAAMALGVSLEEVDEPLRSSLLGLSALGAVGSIAALMLVDRSSRIRGGLEAGAPRWRKIVAHAGTIGIGRVAIMRLILVSLLNLLLGAIAIHAGFASFDIEISPAVALIFGSLFLLSTLIQLTPGNIGIVEGSIGVMAALLGEQAEHAVTVMLVLRVINLAAVALPLPYALAILKGWEVNDEHR